MAVFRRCDAELREAMFHAHSLIECMDAFNDIKLSANPQNIQQLALVDEEFTGPVHHIHHDFAQFG
jgi:hypothetical protein